jgi:hypothetical protein
MTFCTVSGGLEPRKMANSLGQRLQTRQKWRVILEASLGRGRDTYFESSIIICITFRTWFCSLSPSLIQLRINKPEAEQRNL